MRDRSSGVRSLRRLAAGAALLAGAACGGDGGTGPTNEAAGRYDIVQVNDDVTPPFLIAEEAATDFTLRFEIVRGAFELRGDGRYTAVATTRLTIDGQTQGDIASPPQTGRYTANGSTVTFDPTGDDPEQPNFTAVRDGDTLTFDQTVIDEETGEARSVRIVARR